MTGFFCRRFFLRRSKILSRRLRSMRAGLERKRRVNRLVRRSLNALKLAAVEIEERNWRIKEENDLMFVEDTLTNLWINDRLVELENDPLIRNALDERNNINVNQAQPLPGGGGAADDSRD
ncbi:hypothetical protein PTKIN_Ptkin01aG0369100 [Pterospermum kingtungense]